MTSSDTDTQFPLSECTIDDIPSLFKVYLAAFAPSIANELIFPRESMDMDNFLEWYSNSTKARMARPEIKHYKITDTATGEIAAFMRWGFPFEKPATEPIVPPPAALNTTLEPPTTTSTSTPATEDQPPSSKPKSNPSDWPTGTNLSLAAAKFDSLNVWRDKYVDWPSTYVAYLLVTSPSYQKRGFGTRLLNEGLRRADAEGRKAYIEATPEGFPLYEKLGFREVDRMDIDLAEWGRPGRTAVNSAMIREPRGA